VTTWSGNGHRSLADIRWTKAVVIRDVDLPRDSTTPRINIQVRNKDCSGAVKWNGPARVKVNWAAISPLRHAVWQLKQASDDVGLIRIS
jgi:hypothetical protein